MSKDRFVNLADDTNAYCRAFEAYRHRSQKLQLTKDFFINSLPEHLKKLRAASPVRVAGIGSGSGQKDIVLFQKLLEAFPSGQILVDICEPSPELLEIFRKSLDEAKLDSRLSVTFHVKTSQQFRADMAPGTTYDMIYAFECLYYEDSIPTAINEYLQRISTGGMLYVSITTSNSGWHHIAKSYSPDGAQSKAFVGSADVRQALSGVPKEVGIAWDEVELPNTCEVTPVFSETADKIEAFALAEFASHVANFPDIATAEEFQKFKEHLRSSDVSDSTADGRVLMRMPFTMFLVWKGKKE